jgi:rhodanese-related sulfurtransferase
VSFGLTPAPDAREEGAAGVDGGRMSFVRILIVVAAGAALAAAGCAEPKVSRRDVTYVEIDEATALSRGTRTLLGLGDKSGAWIDPRTEDAFREGHIPGAISVPIDEIKAGDRRLAGYNVFIVYGDDYNSPLAEAASKKLIAAGYDDVRTLRGGLRAWRGQGFDLETGDTSANAGGGR